MTGTITWLECDTSHPPPAVDNKYGYSKNVLLTNGIAYEIGNYCHGLNPFSRKKTTSEQT